MASIKKKSSGGGGANWMDTYGDMVTLLLCFFVLLYSMSSIDASKWEWIVQQFNPDGIPSESSVPEGPDGSQDSSGGDALPTTSDMDQALDELFEFLDTYAEDNPEASIAVSRGDGYVFISFDDTVFFDGNSAYIRAEGQALLDGLIPALEKAAPYVDEMKVLGHTAQQTANEPNNIRKDRMLASERATEVVIYFQERIPSDVLDPGRLIAVGHGQWRPVAGNENAVERAKNRRVELMITGHELDELLSDNRAQYYTVYETATGRPVTGGAE